MSCQCNKCWRRSNTLLERFQHLEKEYQIRWGLRYPWSVHEEVAAKTAKVDFGCDFKDDNCKYQRVNGSWSSKPDRVEMCCCANCETKIGYLDAIPVGTARKYLRYWSKKTGFWRKGKGCILPRKMRSPTCLLHICHSIAPRGSVQKLVQIRKDAGINF